MEFYLEIINDKVIEVYSEENGDELIKITCESVDEFYEKVSGYEINEDFDEKIKEFFEDSRNNESLNRFHIKHWVSNRSFGELIDMYEHDEIIKPEMQRDFVWTSLKCSRLIESIILGLPIPPLFLMEVDKNQYELVDGYQRLTTVFNYVKGNPWGGKKDKRNVKAKLSSKVSVELQKKAFEDLEPEHQKAIRRSTIPLIEFKQLEPNNLSSKYLIFERINTGSDKLNQMQIRKSLAYGELIKSLYSVANKSSEFTKLFSAGNLKKDVHVEAYLRILCMTDIYYKKYKPEKYGINYVLNDYCEVFRKKEITDERKAKIKEALTFAYSVFNKPEEIFRKVDMIKGQRRFIGNLNISILEAFIGVYIEEKNKITIRVEEIYMNYISIMSGISTKEKQEGEENFFTTHTGTEKAITKRYDSIKKIFGIN